MPCSRAPRQGPGGELGPLQVAVHNPYLGLFGDLNRRPYGSQSKPKEVTHPTTNRCQTDIKAMKIEHYYTSVFLYYYRLFIKAVS